MNQMDSNVKIVEDDVFQFDIRMQVNLPLPLYS